MVISPPQGYFWAYYTSSVYEVLFEIPFEAKNSSCRFKITIEMLIQPTLPQAKLLPTKTYISVGGKRRFATVKT
jgi:hypothetical protein